MTDFLTIRGARLHNLKNISLDIPKNQLVVLSGLSGSGKSTLGFDILLKEGQRQYMESLGILPFGMARPPVDEIRGLSPTISLGQNLGNRSPRSTVGTLTDVYTYLRVLFARLGRRACPVCGEEIPPSLASAEEEWQGETGSDEEFPANESFPCPHCGAAAAVLSMAHFSFNKPAGACPICTGLGVALQVDLSRLADEQKTLADGAMREWNRVQIDYQLGILRAAAAWYGFEFDLSRPVKDFSPEQRDLLFHGVGSAQFRRHFPQRQPPPTVRQGRFEGAATALLRRYGEHLHRQQNKPSYRDPLEEFLTIAACPECGGTRLRAEARAVTVGGENIVALSGLALDELAVWLGRLPAHLEPAELRLGEAILDDLQARLARLGEAGAGYLSLGQGAPSLSAGELQRLRLAGLLGSGLSGVLYVFDEPTVGLHQRDTRRLIGLLRRLRDLGNTVLVIEHDLEVIAAADHLIDFGPGAGRQGGQIVAQGTPEDVSAAPGSLTGDYLAGRAHIPLPEQRRAPAERVLVIRGARHNNLKHIDVRLPLGLLVAVTGVSGSGKSSLIFDILDRAARRRLNGPGELPGAHDGIDGLEYVDQVITIDQDPLRGAPHSNAATYTDTFTPIREAFAALPEARRLGFSARHFSFNLPGGRCERCQGAGVIAVNMHFLPEVDVRCPVCRGRRFSPQVLAVRYRGLDISQVLELTVEEALAFFADIPAAQLRFQVLCDVGLGYLQLGQPADTLSGGEAQRVKLSRELGRRSKERTLYLLDEPTTGLHLADTARLLGVLRRLVEGGGSVVVVEHNLDLVRAADWVIDLGPEGGAGGGRLVAEGTPEEVAQAAGSFTGKYLREILNHG